mgnify:CR=1 FL=1
MSLVSANAESRALGLLRERGGLMRTKDALAAGISPRTWYHLRDAGYLERVSRGVYRLPDSPAPAEIDLAAVSARAPSTVICLISALAFHTLTTQIPHVVHIAIEKGSDAPRIDYPPISVYWFGGAAYSEGTEDHLIEGVNVRVYGPEKTLADCFKFRNAIGLDVALEALRLYRDRNQPVDVEALLRFARICRVERVMRPYLEATL